MVRRLAPLAPIFWAALCLLLLELGLEFRAAARGHRAVLLMRDPGVDAAPNPNAVFGPRPDFPYRSRVTAPAEAAAAHAVWLASSSYGEDVYIPVRELFATHLATALGQPVINASRGGMTIPLNVAALRTEAAAFAPEFALLYQMSNDLDQVATELAARMPTGATPGGATEGDPQDPAPTTATGFAPVAPWFQEMTVYRHLKGHVASRLAQHLPLWDAMPDPALARSLFLARVTTFVEAARAVGAQPVLITFATAYDNTNVDQVPGALARQNLAMNTTLSSRGWIATITAWNAALKAYGAEAGIPVIDLAGTFTGRTELFRDFWHLTPEGHAAVGAFLADALAARFPELAR